MAIVETRQQLTRQLKKAKVIFIATHRDMDLDAIGSALGMYAILMKLKKKCYIVTNDTKNELGVEKVLNEVKDKITLLSTQEIQNYRHKKEKRNLLIILDTNKSNLLPDPNMIDWFSQILILDHHEYTENSIQKGSIMIDRQVSSTCEILAQLIEYYRIKMDTFMATVLLAGIVLDTNNFTLKTTAITYYTAYYLTSLGADPKKVQYLLKQDLTQYIERQKTITNVEILKNQIAFSVSSSKIIYRREDLAKMADTLLFFNNIEASFVIGKIDQNSIGISARSMGNIPIQKILETLGGGGDSYNAAARIENMTLKQVENQLKKAIELEEAE